MTNEKLLKIIRVLSKAKMRDYHAQLERGDKEEARRCLHESMAYDSVDWLITDEEYAEKIMDIYDIDLTKEVTL